MRWLDLSPYELTLGLVRTSPDAAPQLVAAGQTAAHAHALRSSGFEPDAERAEWMFPGTRLPAEFWARLRAEFPAARIVEVDAAALMKASPATPSAIASKALRILADAARVPVANLTAAQRAQEASEQRAAVGEALAGGVEEHQVQQALFDGGPGLASARIRGAVPRGAHRSTPRQISYTKVGEHRGRKRLWLEGLRLADCGFEPGARFTVSLDVERRSIALTLDPAGERTVSRRARGTGSPTPIVDVCADSLEDVLGSAGRVRAQLHDGRIEFTLHPTDVAIAEREQRLAAHLQVGRVTEGVFCAGGGVSAMALQEGLEAAGLETSIEWIVDREARYLDAARSANPAIVPSVALIEASLEELEPGLLGPVDVVTLSLPCTGHSLSGKAKRGLVQAEDHPTDALAVYGALKLLESVQPCVVISENVTQAATSATYALMRAYLKEQGYVIAERVLNEDDAGSLERRERWWLVGISRGYAANLTLEMLPLRPRQHERLGDVLEPIASDDAAWSTNDYLQRKAERDAAAGKGFARQHVTPESESVGCVGRGYFKRRSTEPFVSREDGKERLLTPREHARVKGVPEEFQVEKLSQQISHEILGQSILYHHATALAECIGRHLRNAIAPRPPLTLDAAIDALPRGWTESAPGRMATSADPETGGIVDQAIADGTWFYVANRDGVESQEGYATRADAFDALQRALAPSTVAGPACR